MTQEKFEKAFYITKEMENLREIGYTIENAYVDNVKASLCALRRSDSGYEIVNEVNLTKDIQNKLLDVIDKELDKLNKEFEAL